jgi:predicted enzyme related to lactoylglutathione lyase
MGKVTGIGGIFFKCKDPKKIRQWYEANLGVEVSPYGAKFEWRSNGPEPGYTLWTPFPDTTKYFEPSAQPFMINYRVDDLEALVAELASKGVAILDDLVDSDYGKFVHILDCEGNKIELWQPK